VHLHSSGNPETDGLKVASNESEVRKMEAVVIGAAFLGSIATAFVVQKAVLGAMLRAIERGRSL
jgi:hypothetical protein